MKALTFKQYKLIDLTLLSVLFVIGETIVTVAGGKWFPGQPYSLSVAILFFCIGLMRWGAGAAIFAPLGGAVYCLASSVFMENGVKAETFAIYCIGNLAMLFALLTFKFLGKEQIRLRPLYTIIYVLCVYLFTELGRFCVSFIFEQNLKILPAFLTTDALSGVFALVVVLAIRKQDGLFEDQKTYLLRLDAEKQKEKQAEEEFADRI